MIALLSSHCTARLPGLSHCETEERIRPSFMGA
jgi:hypothetical protein